MDLSKMAAEVFIGIGLVLTEIYQILKTSSANACGRNEYRLPLSIGLSDYHEKINLALWVIRIWLFGIAQWRNPGGDRFDCGWKLNAI